MPTPSHEQTKPQSAPLLSIVGLSGSGKTTLLERVIEELKDRGYRLAVIKHHHHPGLRIDAPGTDSWRFARAGADHVVLVGPDTAFHLHTFAQAPSLEEIASAIQGVDLIITEGYKRAHAPKIAVVRAESGVPPMSEPPNVLAVASDRPTRLRAPHFDIDDFVAVADFVEDYFLRPSNSASA